MLAFLWPAEPLGLSKEILSHFSADLHTSSAVRQAFCEGEKQTGVLKCFLIPSDSCVSAQATNLSALLPVQTTHLHQEGHLKGSIFYEMRTTGSQ